ncbi:copper chaperone PCu(A)C [Kordiimonas laminariae]|uniref:copper chaperone PCu(A)C n=1 Tax=Kordiimonas laminariae TaxID=2917717 RepID=UPI001FF50CDE|nr:copper chaperone PCu(A)C [Kordiimonas laminariae]MCK0069180.1 copper chaperone PCu(A)C [Kordiimonas laminariae]
MKSFLLTLLSSLFLFTSDLAAFDGNHSHGITIDQPWAPHTGRRTMSAAVYFKIHNNTHHADKLVGVETDLAEIAMLHRSYEDDGIMKMDHVEALEIPAGGDAALEPGSYHIMLMRLEQPLKRGEVFPLSLQFEKAGTVQVIVEITGVGGPK